MNNSFYGKAMENLRKRIKVRLVNNAKNNKKYLSKPSFVSQKIFSKTFVAIHQIKSVLTLDKPIYVGFIILNFRKFLMYEFHYKYVGRKYDNSGKLLFTDTDSLFYEIETNYIYKDFYENKSLFDFSNYPEDSKCFDPVNKILIGKMKDEVKRRIINEFVELMSNVYPLVIVNNEEIKKAKGVNENVAKA